MFLPALVGVLGLLVTGWAPPATAAGAGPRYEPALEVTIDTMSPGHLPTDGPIRIFGSVTNQDDVPWSNINLYPFLGTSPMLTQDELTAAAASDPLLAVGERITATEASDNIPALDPGETENFSLVVPADLLETNGPGVYWFGVHALGESIDAPRDPEAAVADGRARTFLPYIPPGTPGQVKTALVLPIRHFLPYADDGALEGLEHWQRTLSVGGRLRDLVDFASSAGSTPVTWLVDPAVPDAVRKLARGNPPLFLGPSATPAEDEEEEEPEETQSDEPSESADPEAQAAEERELTDEERAAQEAALSWLDRFGQAIQGDEVLGLPYGDLDVAAAAELAPDLYGMARERTGVELTERGVTSTPTVVSPSGYLNDAAFELLPDDTTVLVSDRMFGADPPGVADIGGKTVGILSTGAADGGPRPGNRFTSLQLRQRILSEAAVRLLSPGRHPLIVALPLEWEPTDPSAFFSGLEVDWLDLTTVADATDRDGTIVEADELAYPASQQRRQLDPPSFTAADELISAGETLQNLLTLNNEVSEVVTDRALTGVSYGSRETPIAARGRLVDAQEWIDGVLGSITISAGPGVTLSGSDGGFATVIENTLDEPVTVNVVARSDGGVEIAPIQPVELAANSRSTIVLDAHAIRVGVTNVTLALTDDQGNPLGQTAELPIRSAQVSVVIWLIIGTGVGLLFLAILVRLIRRVRNSRRSEEALTVVDPAVAPAVEAPLEPTP